MSMVKREWERQMEEGWSSRSGYVCARCFTDYAIQEFIEANTTEKECSYCGRTAKKPIAAELNEVMSFISAGIWREYDIPENCLPYDSSEGGWQLATPMDSNDLFEELDICGADSGNLFEDLADSFSDTYVVPRDPLVLSRIDGLKYSWSTFCDIIKHETRFVFFRVPVPPRPAEESWHPDDEWDRRYSAPYEILLNLGSLVETHGLIRNVPAGTKAIRARQHQAAENYDSAADLGSPPREKASQSRMSPAGIAMFYGASNERTAFLETFDAKRTDREMATFGLFTTTRELQVLDLTNLPRIPSLFDEKNFESRADVLFLYHVQRDMAAAIERDGREHYEYVPTQVVAEYFRRVFRHAEKPVDGIFFRSSRKGAESCFCFFANADDCLDKGATGRNGMLQFFGARRAKIDFKKTSFEGDMTLGLGLL